MEETHRAMHGEGVWSFHDLSMGTVLPEFSHGRQLGISTLCFGFYGDFITYA